MHNKLLNLILVLLLLICALYFVTRLLSSGSSGARCGEASRSLSVPASPETLQALCAGVGRASSSGGSVSLVDVETICPKAARDGTFKTREQLCAYILTGQYSGADWNGKAKSVALPLEERFRSHQKVLLLEEGAKRYVSSDLDCVGIVVRRGAQLLFLDEGDVEVRCEFCLCESAGLIQAGTTCSRFGHKLTFTFKSPSSDYGPVQSEYAASVYAPDAGDAKDFAGHDMASMSHFDWKSFAIGFNGTLCLCGGLPESARYNGTWGVEGDITMNSGDLLSVSESDEASLRHNIETGYPCVWARLADGVYPKGATTLYLDARDTSSASGSPIALGWKQNDRIVVTARSTKSYLSPDDATQTGMLPLWMNHPVGSPDYAANESANQAILKDSTTGVEVCTVGRVYLVSGRYAVELKEPLHLDHDSTRQTLTSTTINGTTKRIVVDTQLHVALLTRNIVITSELRPVKDGQPDRDSCNVWHYDKTKTGKYGTVVCNAFASNESASTTYQRCYAELDTDVSPKFASCGDLKPDSVSKGHWLFGTSTLSGCDAIWGGQLLAKMGANVVLDGVEFDRFGTPGNFGSIARYPIHFHLCGFSASFNEYSDIQRQLTVSSCSIWRSFSRWVTVHGTHEANVKNTVGFIAFGSPFFVEDGCEVMNTFEHNIGISALPASFNAYWNPIPIYGNVSSDLCQLGMFWLKNSRNRLLRNVCCCSPNPVIGIWMVPQPIQELRGPSTLPAGDSATQIPVIGAQTNCYAPQRFRGVYTDEGGCTPFNIENGNNPYGLIAENVCYNLAGGLSEFPEFISNGLPDVNGNLTNSTSNPLACNAASMGFTTPDENGRFVTKIPQFIPINGQNACTDSIVSSYMEPMWLKSINDYVPADVIEDPKSQSFRVKAAAVPKIIQGMFTYNLGANGNNLWGGPGWTKNGVSFILNSCFLDFLGGTCLPMGPVTNGRQAVATYPQSSSSVWSYTTGGVANSSSYANSFNVFFNIVSSGAFGISANPTVMGGPKAFVSDSTTMAALEYSRGPQGANVCYFLDNTFQNIFPAVFFTNPPSELTTSPPINMRLIDVDSGEVYDYSTLQKSVPQLVSGANLANSKTRSRKYPYICGGASDEWGLLRFPNLYGEYAEALVSGSFVTGRGIALGNKLCDMLSRIPNFVCPAFPGGMTTPPIEPPCLQTPLAGEYTDATCRAGDGNQAVKCKVDYL